MQNFNAFENSLVSFSLFWASTLGCSCLVGTKEDLVGCRFVVCRLRVVQRQAVVISAFCNTDVCYYWIRFDVDRAKEAGVSPGPMCARLQQGHSVLLQDGRTVSFI